MLDFGGPDSARGGFLAHLLHSSHRLKDNAESQILTLMRGAGYADPRKVGQGSMLLGSISITFYQASARTSQ